MPKVMCFHSKIGTHIQQLDYESVPFGCFHCLKTRHKAFQCPKAKMAKKKFLSSSSLNRDKKVWKNKTTNLGQKDGSKITGQKVAEDKKDKDQKLSSSSTMTQSKDNMDVPKLRSWSQLQNL